MRRRVAPKADIRELRRQEGDQRAAEVRARLRETEQAQLIIKVAPGEEVTALVSSLHDFPRTVLDKASALIRSIAQ